MNIRFYGRPDQPSLLLLQGSCMNVDIWEETIAALQEEFYVVLPVLPGHDYEQNRHFFSVSATAEELMADLRQEGIYQVDLAYGLSLGGSVLIKLLEAARVDIDCAILDGGILPHGHSKGLAFLIGVGEYLQGKLFTANRRLTSWMMVKSGYPEALTDRFFDGFSHLSNRSLFRIFYGCHNYPIRRQPLLGPTKVHYWYGEKEEKARRVDRAVARQVFPELKLRVFPGCSHGQLSIQPQALLKALKETQRVSS